MILISGADGFIGEELRKLLSKKKIPYKKIKTRQILKKKKVFFKKISHFIHLGFNFYRKKNNFSKDKNLIYIKKIINLAKIFKFKIIFPSTSTYKYTGKKKIISNKIYPYDKYSLSKVNCEKILKKFQKKNDGDVTILRIFNVYGKNQRPGWLVPDIIKKFSNKKNTFVKLKHYQNTRDFIHVKDVSSAIYKSLKLKGLKILNVGSSQETTILKVAEIISYELNSNKKIVYLQKKSKNNSISKADISNTKKILKWKPSIKIEAGLKKILQHEKKIKN